MRTSSGQSRQRCRRRRKRLVKRTPRARLDVELGDDPVTRFRFPCDALSTPPAPRSRPPIAWRLPNRDASERDAAIVSEPTTDGLDGSVRRGGSGPHAGDEHLQRAVRHVVGAPPLISSTRPGLTPPREVRLRSFLFFGQGASQTSATGGLPAATRGRVRRRTTTPLRVGTIAAATGGHGWAASAAMCGHDRSTVCGRRPRSGERAGTAPRVPLCWVTSVSTLR